MKTQWSFNRCDNFKNQARSYWQQKQPRLERLSTDYSLGLRRVCLTLYQHQSRNEWELRAVMHLRTGQLVAEDVCPTLNEVIDGVADKLAANIAHHKNQVQRNRLHGRRRIRKQQMVAVGASLLQDVEAKRVDAFSDLLLPYADQLYDHARHELKALEEQGVIAKNEWSPSDLVNETLLRAYHRYDQRFDHVAVDVWLINLLNESLEELCQGDLPLSVAVPETEVVISDDEGDADDLDDVHYWIDRLLEPPQTLSLEEMVPDQHWSDVWDDLSTEERREQLASLLQELPKHQRQTLMLRDAYGFEFVEIERALGRSSHQVKSDLTAAREKVRAGLETTRDS